MKPRTIRLLRTMEPGEITETGKILLQIASLLGAAGRQEDATAALDDGLALLEHAAELTLRRARDHGA